jgi:hypothetical protein
MPQRPAKATRLSVENASVVRKLLLRLKVKDRDRFLSSTRKAFTRLLGCGIDNEQLDLVLRYTAEYSALLMLEDARPGRRSTLHQRRRALDPAARDLAK